MKPELSIIIPCYNSERTLREAVDSCFKQGLTKPFEIIMVDDKSTDNTIEVMRTLAGQHPEIQLFFHGTNLGGGATRNTAVKNSTGNVIFCLDSDDILPDRTLVRMLAALTSRNSDGLTIHRSIKFSGTDIQKVHHVDSPTEIDSKITLESLLQKNGLFCPLYVNFMYTRKAFNKLGGYPISHGFDTQGFAWRFICSGLTAYVCKDAEYLHRIHFNESYYLREYNAGGISYNWRDILLEHYYVFNKKALYFILAFNCQDFTRNILTELSQIDDVFVRDYINVCGKIHPTLKIKLAVQKRVKRSSLKGYYYRLRHRFIELINKNEYKKRK